MPITVRSHLSLWINFLLSAVPIRSRATFIELLCGCLVSPEGWVSRAIGAISRGKHWTTYYKFLERGNVGVLSLSRALLHLILFTASPILGIITLVIDDTLILRTSERAPASIIRHDHSNKKNRPKFVLSQCWVTLGISVFGIGDIGTVFPILSRLVPSTGNRNKLKIAQSLIRSVLGGTSLLVRVLFDSWYMRGPLVLPLLRRGIHVLGQVRHDTALYLFPKLVEGQRCRGRPRIYGEKITLESMLALPVIELVLFLYGKKQRVRLRSIIVLARFLKATPVRAVWCELFDEKTQGWRKPMLLLATETELTAEEVVSLYARRWGIETLFFNLKRWWGVNNLWQQSRRVLELWMMIRSTAWTLTQLLVMKTRDEFPMDIIAPWRKNRPLTAGLIAQWMRMEFFGLSFRGGYDRKSRKFLFPEQRHDPRLRL
jgi:hypothetical protein